jgi:hypothetical protein
MSVVKIIAIVLGAWCVLSLIGGFLFSLAMRGMNDDPPSPEQPATLHGDAERPTSAQVALALAA